ncbi:hypothetical protein FAZ98_31505 [Paraburkholderia acidisoli]|uniref:Restriction alleviation protein Lar n=2 Tax=Paraburkholderia acidisoli TaxID=2571748 RepID=A0A7Z2JHY5_9BURK|nr:hypothetical protein FAZ98_31505 [Paraburkholderia acidisoli]
MRNAEKVMSSELKHCPFCRRLLSGIQPSLGLVQVVCEICEAAGPTAETEEEAISAWNSADPALVAALQKALAYWMPKVFDDRSAHDAYLLVGYEGEDETSCWGDQMVAALPRWMPVDESLPTEPDGIWRSLSPITIGDS